MQYESIILELMSRIKTLEEDIALLKKQIAANDRSATAEASSDHTANSSVQYQKMTDEMIELCYKYGKKMLDGSSAQDLADDLAETTGMNRNSAVMYLYAVHGMLTGTTYKRAINTKAMKYFMQTIFNEYGSKGLKKAITASRNHIQYRRDLGHQVDSLDDICKEFEDRL